MDEIRNSSKLGNGGGGDDDGSSTTALTDVQYKVLAILPIPTAMLNIFGSYCIISMACRRRRNQRHNGRNSSQSSSSWTPYTRLLVGMSICDIISSMNLSISTFLRPAETSHRAWAFGNDATCSASGFVAQLANSAILYNGMLSFYFLLAARFGWSNTKISKWIEPMMHFISLGFPAVTASVGAALGVYSEPEFGMGCWVNDYPRNCGDGPGETGEPCKSELIGWIFGAFTFNLVGGSILINNLIIWTFVRRQTRPRQQQRGGKQQPRSSTASSSILLDVATGKENGPELSVSGCGDDGETQELGISDKFTAVEANTLGGNRNVAPCDIDSSRRSGNMILGDIHASSLLGPASMDDELIDLSSVHEDEADDGAAAVAKSHSRGQDCGRTRDQLRRLQLVGSQALLFVGSYVICNIWTGLLGLFEASSDTPEGEKELASRFYAISVLNAFFLPLQGLFNMIVYVRPKYLKMRSEFPTESRVWAFRRAMHGDSYETTKERNDRRWEVPPTKQQSPNVEPITHPAVKKDNLNEHTKQLRPPQELMEECSGPSSSNNMSSLAPTQTTGQHFEHCLSQSPSSSSLNWTRMQRTGELMSSVTASLGDFDEDKLDKEVVQMKDRGGRWTTSPQDSSFVAPLRRHTANDQFTSLRGSSLEMISELSELIFDEIAEESSESYSTVDGSSFGGEIENRRWSCSPIRNSPTKTSATTVEKLIMPRRAESQFEFDSSCLGDDSTDCSEGVNLERSERRLSVDTPLRRPMRRISPTPNS